MPAPVDISDPFRALSDPTRREILSLLAAGALPVRMIAGQFPSISRPAVSKHLRILREGGLVSEERSGRERYYRLELGTVESTLDWIASLGAKGTSAPQTASKRAVKSKPAQTSLPREHQKPGKRSNSVNPEAGVQAPRSPEPEPETATGAGVDSDEWKSW